MARDNQLYCFSLDGFWMDVGQPKDFLTGLYIYIKIIIYKKLRNVFIFESFK